MALRCLKCLTRKWRARAAVRFGFLLGGEAQKRANHKIWILPIFEQRDVFCFIGFRLTKKHASRTLR